MKGKCSTKLGNSVRAIHVTSVSPPASRCLASIVVIRAQYVQTLCRIYSHVSFIHDVTFTAKHLILT